MWCVGAVDDEEVNADGVLLKREGGTRSLVSGWLEKAGARGVSAET